MKLNNNHLVNIVFQTGIIAIIWTIVILLLQKFYPYFYLEKGMLNHKYSLMLGLIGIIMVFIFMFDILFLKGFHKYKKQIININNHRLLWVVYKLLIINLAVNMCGLIGGVYFSLGLIKFQLLTSQLIYTWIWIVGLIAMFSWYCCYTILQYIIRFTKK